MRSKYTPYSRALTSADVGRSYARVRVYGMCILTARSLVHHDQLHKVLERGTQTEALRVEAHQMVAETTTTWTASREIVATVVGRVDGKRVGAGRINGGILRGKICGRVEFSNRLDVGTSVVAETAVELRRLQQSTKRFLVVNVPGRMY